MHAADKNRDELKSIGVLEPLCPLLASPTDTIRNTSSCLAATLVVAQYHILLPLTICRQFKSFEVRRAVRAAKHLAYAEYLVKLLAASESSIARENAWYSPGRVLCCKLIVVQSGAAAAQLRVQQPNRALQTQVCKQYACYSSAHIAFSAIESLAAQLSATEAEVR